MSDFTAALLQNTMMQIRTGFLPEDPTLKSGSFKKDCEATFEEACKLKIPYVIFDTDVFGDTNYTATYAEMPDQFWEEVDHSRGAGYSARSLLHLFSTVSTMSFERQFERHPAEVLKHPASHGFPPRPKSCML